MDFDELRQLLQGPLAIQVATSGEDLAPYMVRGFGVELIGDELRVGVVEAQAALLLATLRRTRRIAVNLSHPNRFVGRQLKGPLVAIDEPSAEAAKAAADYLERFAQAIAAFGVNRQQAQGMFFSKSPILWVRMKPQDYFDQSPGSGAGKRLSP
jgi:hypothetical protein